MAVKEFRPDDNWGGPGQAAQGVDGQVIGHRRCKLDLARPNALAHVGQSLVRAEARARRAGLAPVRQPPRRPAGQVRKGFVTLAAKQLPFR